MIFELGISSADTVTLEPNWSMKFPRKMKRSESRSQDGSYYEYVWYLYDGYDMQLEYVTATDVAKVNSWWQSRAQLLLFITSSTATEVHSVMIMNNEIPFAEFQKPYDNLYKGKLKLDTYGGVT